MGINGVRPTGIHTAEPLVYEPSAIGVKMTVEKQKSYKSPSNDGIPVEQRIGQFVLRSFSL
jgi:hypothetical protein